MQDNPPVCIETKQDQTLKIAESNNPVTKHPINNTLSVQSGEISDAQKTRQDFGLETRKSGCDSDMSVCENRRWR